MKTFRSRKEYVAAYYREHKAAILAQQRARRIALTPDDINKQREYQRKYRHRNKSKISGYLTERRETLRSAKSKPCMDCGITYPWYIMEFDHREAQDKSFTLGGSWSLRGIGAITAEIKKCDVLCANCHAARTWKRSHGGL